MRAPIAPCTLLLALAAATSSACAQVDEPCVAADALVDAPTSLALVEGGRGFLALRAYAGITVTIDGLVPGFTTRVREDGVHVVRVPYGIAGTLPATLTATCDDGDRASASLELVVAPLAVRSLAPLEDGPGARDAPGMAVVPAGVVVVGGTFDRAALADAWLLPRGSDAWTRIDVELAARVGAGSIRATAMDDGRVLLLGPAGATAILDVTDTGTLEVVTPGGAVPDESDGAAFVRAPSSTSVGAPMSTLALCGRGVARHCRATAFDDVDGAAAPWRLLEPTGFAPAGRDGAIVDVDLESRRLILFGGQLDDGVASDAWTLALDDVGTDAIAWQHHSHAASGDEEPTPRRGACGAIDPVGHRFLVVGGVGGVDALGTSNASNARGLIAFDLDIERTPSFDAERPKAWRTVDVDGMPDGSAGCAAAWDAVDGRMIVGFGTRADDAPSTTLWALDVSP